jgi:hypothetical protein
MRYVVAMALITTLSCAQAFGGEIYCNKLGRECSDRPGPGKSIVHVAGNGRSTVTSTTAADNGGNASSAAIADPVEAAQRQSAALNKANAEVQKDVSDKRTAQCKKAQDYYTQAINASGIYRTDKDGKKQLLTEAEANKSRLDAKLEINRTCGSAG